MKTQNGTPQTDPSQAHSLPGALVEGTCEHELKQATS